MKHFIAIIILVFFTKNIFAIKQNGIRLSIFEIYPKLTYGYILKKDKNEKQENFNLFGGELALSEGKKNILLNQTFKGTYTHNRENPFDYNISVDGLINSSNKFRFKTRASTYEIKNHIDSIWFEENNTKKNSLFIEAAYDSGAAFSSSFKYIFDKSNTSTEIFSQDRKTHSTDLRLSLRKSKTFTNLFSIIFDESINKNLNEKKNILDFENIITFEPILKSIIGIGYKHSLVKNSVTEKTPYIKFSKNIGHRTFFDSKFGKTVTDENDEALFIKVEIQYQKSEKTYLNAWYNYGVTRDPFLNRFKSYTLGLNFTRNNNTGIIFKGEGRTDIIKNNLTDNDERKYFLTGDIKYILNKCFALNLNYEWSKSIQIGKISIIGFL